MKIGPTIAASALLLGAVAGCGQDGPFSLTVTEVNESGPQRNAVIALSDPQIYTRERLLNDREDEIKYLRTQLELIDTKRFTPRLRRDLDMLVELALALSVKFNPIAGAEVSQAAEIAELKNDIQIEQLENLLAKVQAENTAAADGSAGANPATSTDALKAAELETVVALTQSLLNQLEKARDDRLGKTPPILRDNTVTEATPSEELRDKLAYRNEIQSALEQAQLDDRHDLNGNALYRLQFKATVFPGQVKDKYGIARLTILPPLFEDNYEISKLYMDWLAYATSQLNPSPEARELATADEAYLKDRYKLLGPAAGLYSITRINYKEVNKIDPAVLDNLPSDLKTKLQKLSTTLATPANTQALSSSPTQIVAPRGEAAASQDMTQTPTSSDGWFDVPVPPRIAPLGVQMAVDPRYTQSYITLFKSAATVFHKADEYLRWSVEDKDQCQTLTLVRRSDLVNVHLEVSSTTSEADRAQALVDMFEELENQGAITSSSKDDLAEMLALAITAARNVHNLAPAYILGIQRTAAQLSRRGDVNAVNVLSKRAEALSDVKVAADALLQALHDKLLEPAKTLIETDSQNPGEKSLYDKLFDGTSFGTIKEDIAKQEALESQDRSKPRSKSYLSRIEGVIPCLSLERISSRIFVPDAFYDTVVSERSDHYLTDDRRPLAGPTYAYSTAPIELAQRVSTVASATQALDLIASISAVIPQAGVGANAAGQLRQIASGHVDAIESAPLIVGFSNNGAAGVEGELYGAHDLEPNFGWVFGPKVTVDADDSQLALSQVLVQQPVTADISVPGWWRSMRLRIETAWAANFHDGIIAGAAFDGQSNRVAQPNERVTDYVVDVPLQTNPATYEQLTEFIANKTWGLQYKEPAITSVEPLSLPACDKATLLISGTDLWRGTQAYLRGISASNIKIMPDMQGLAATFDLSTVAPGPATLVVWTQLGKVQWKSDVAIAPAGACAKSAADGAPKATVVGPSALVLVENEDLIFKIGRDPLSNSYLLVLRRPKDPAFLHSFKTGISQTNGVFTVTWPVAGIKAAYGANTPAEGEPFEAQLLGVNADGTTSTLAALPPLYFYGGKLTDRLTGSAKVARDGLRYTVTVSLNNFRATFGDAVSAKVTGLKEGDTTVPAVVESFSSDDKAATLTFSIPRPLTNVDQTAKIELSVNGRTVPFQVSLKP